LRVVATTADLGSLVRTVGGDRVDVLTLARPTEDPHFVDPRPSYLVRFLGPTPWCTAGRDSKRPG